MKKKLFTVLVVAALFSCKKSDDTAPVEASLDINIANLTGSYKLTSSLKNDGTTNTDLYSTMADCQKDDVYTYGATGNFTRAEAALVCSPTNAEVGTYTLTGTQVTYAIAGNTFVETISKITATKLTTTSSYGFGSTTYTVTSVYTKQ